MQIRFQLLIPAVTLLGVTTAQTESPQATTDWRLPFRTPDVNLEPPAEMYEQLRAMQTLVRRAKPNAVFFDEYGIERVEDPAWQAAYDRLMNLRQDAGYLSLVIRDSRNSADRSTAFYGSFYLPDAKLILSLIEHIPGEPNRVIREDAYNRAVAFLRVQLPKRNEGDLEEWKTTRAGPAGQRPPKPGEFSYGFDLMPFAKLLDVEDHRDWIQVLWFFGECIKVRPELHEPILHLTRERLPHVLNSEKPGVLEAVRDFVTLADPKHREPPPLDAARRRYVNWLDNVLHDVFPPIRHISAGLTQLHPSDDLDRIIAAGKQILRNGSIGDPANGKLKNGSYYRGLRIARAPEPLDKLRLQIGWIVTSINGVPVATPKEVLRLFGQFHQRTSSFLIEYVRDGELRAKEFRLIPPAK